MLRLDEGAAPKERPMLGGLLCHNALTKFLTTSTAIGVFMITTLDMYGMGIAL
jgi:hypothetical protein